MTSVEQRLTELEAEVDRLKVELSVERAQDVATPLVENVRPSLRSGSSRRTLFKVGAAAAVAAAATPLLPGRVAATDGSALLVGQVNSSASGSTRVQANVGGGAMTDNVFTAADGGSGSQIPAALGGFGFNNRVSNGVYAFSGGKTEGTQLTGHAVIARPSSSARSHVYMFPVGIDPRQDVYVHGAGEFRADQIGQLWYCVESGTPGMWRRIAGTTTSGAMHAISPQRVYDSRLADGRLASGADRTISVANGIDPATGAVSVPNLVPDGATAVLFNVTVDATLASGFLNVAPGGTTTALASTINWSSSGLILANASMSTVDVSRRLKIFCAGGGSTHFIIDITAYTL